MLGTDISDEALQVAEDNALRVGNIWGLGWLRSDLFAEIPTQRFDLITANPPYIPTDELSTLDATIRNFEPQLALDGGPDGLHIIRRIVHEAPEWLEPDGIVAIEIAFNQAAAVTGLLNARGFVDVACNKDYGGRDRVVSARWAKSG